MFAKLVFFNKYFAEINGSNTRKRNKIQNPTSTNNNTNNEDEWKRAVSYSNRYFIYVIYKPFIRNAEKQF